MTRQSQPAGIECRVCGAAIQAATAENTETRCMPCFKAASPERRVSPVVRWVFVLLAISCIGLVSTIEILNLRCNDAISRKMEQEPHSRWRILASRSARLSYERDFKIARGLDWAEPIPADGRMAFERYAEFRWKSQLTRYYLGHAMKWSFLGIPVGLVLGLGSLLVVANSRQSSLPLYGCLGMIGGLAFFTCLLRYFPLLGW